MTADGVNTAMSKLLENQVRHALRRARQKARAVRGGGRGLEGENLLSTAAPPVAHGVNENTNGLLRKYCPNDEYIEKAV